jgi:formate hydrogenlyase subunit 3/multisubunit Na+/H+ antiporter MnhD subunit
MSPETIWLQFGCIAILYTQSKITEPKMNSFLRMFTTVPLGIFAGNGFWKTWQMIQGQMTLSTFSHGQLALYALTILAAACVVGSMIFLVHRLFTK